MAFNITNVTNQTISTNLGIHRFTFSLQDALFPGSGSAFIESSYNGSSYLFADACRLGDETQNCTATCSSGSTMFANLQNLHNCMAYPGVANQYQKKNLTQEAQALVEALRIEPASPDSSLVSNITHNIETCLIDYCYSIPGCADAFQEVYPDNFDLYTDGEYLVSTICTYLPLQINTDIGGIGVKIPEAYEKILLTLGRSTFPTGFRLVWHCSGSWSLCYMTPGHTMDVLSYLLYHTGSKEQAKKLG